jgi:TP901 family phage tail tape measure protein
MTNAFAKVKPPKAFGNFAAHALGNFGGNMLSGGFNAITGGISDAAGGVIDFERSLVRLQIAGNSTPESMNAVRDSIRAISRDTGIASADILKAASSYVAITGDADGAKNAMATFAKVAVATGSTAEATSAVAASMRQNLKIDPKDFEQGFSILNTQAKAGAIELADLNQQMASVAPGFQDFAGAKSLSGLAEMGAALQVVRQNFGDTAEAMTGFRGMTTELQRHMKELKRAGVDIIDPKTGKMRDFLEIMTEISKNAKLMKTGGLLGVLGEEKAVRATRAVLDNLEFVKRLKEDGMHSDSISADALAYQASTAGKLDKTFNQLRETAAQLFTPDRIKAFADGMQGIADAAGGIVSALNGALEKWQQIRELTSDPHEHAVNLAASAANASPEQLDKYADELEERAKQKAMASKVAHDASDGWFGRVLGVASPGMGMVRAFENDADIEAAAKMRRNAAAKRANFARVAQRTEVLNTGGFSVDPGAFVGPGATGGSPVDYKQMGLDIAAALVKALSDTRPATVNVSSEGLRVAVASAKGQRTLHP